MIVFAHVPKTAGTSITSVIVRYLERVAGVTSDAWLLYGREIPYARLDLLESPPPGLRFLSGHFRGPHYEHLLRHRPFIFASIRDPFERFCSGLEHVHRLIEGDLPASPDMLEKGRIFLAEIGANRQNRTSIEAAMRTYRSDGVGLARRVIAYGDRLVPHARIESTEVARLCERLAELSNDHDGVMAALEQVSSENIWPVNFFGDYGTDDLAMLRECFERVFADDLHLIRFFVSSVPSLFEPGPWSCFIDGLTTGSIGRPLWDPPAIPEPPAAAT